MEAVRPGITIRYSFRAIDGGEGPWVPLREPVALDAAPGEEREYRVILRADSDGAEVERRELWVRIDRRPPAPPRIQPSEGTAWAPVPVTFAAGDAGDRVFYAVQSDVTAGASAWDGVTPVVVGSAGARRDLLVQAYAVDAAGNRSAITSARFTVDARPAELSVLSPVAGTFANTQVLAVSFRNVAWVRYTLDGSDPATGGTAYAGPVPIRRQGTTTVRIAAQPRAARAALLRREVTWTVAPDPGSGLALDAESGSYPQGLMARVAGAAGGTVYYALWEKTPGESDYLASAPISVPASGSAARAVTLRLRSLSDGGRWSAEYRWLFIVGEGGPARPVVSVFGEEPLRAPTRVQAVAPEDCLLFMTTDGSRPIPGTSPAAGSVDVVPLPGVTSAALRAVAVDGYGRSSAVAERTIALDSDPGSAPVIGVLARGPAALIVGPAAGDRRTFVYEMTSDGTEPPPPGAGSPKMPAPLTLSLPYGMERTFRVRAAALDSAGRVLAPSATAVARVSRTPPSKPVLSPSPGGPSLDQPTAVSLASPGTVYWTLSADGTAPPDPVPGKAASGASIALPGVDGALTVYQAKIVAVDPVTGLVSETWGPLSWTVDMRPPRLSPLLGAADGGTYNSRSVTLRAAEEAWKTVYSATTDGSEPPDPTPSSASLGTGVVFQGEDGRVTTVKVKLLALSTNGARSGERAQLAFAIDLQPPDVPALAGADDGGRYARPVAVSAAAAQPDVTVYASVSTDGTEPADPVAGGQVYRGTMTLDAPAGARRDFVLRFGAVDSAGNRSLYDRRIAFSVDRSVPDDPIVAGLPPGGISGRPVTIVLQASRGRIVYELTEDGSAPQLPTGSSAAYASPLLLTGRAGASVTYRLLPRAFDDLGNGSRAAVVSTITVDRTVPASPAAARVDWSAANPGIAYVSWTTPWEGSILYRLRPDAEWARYEGPFSVPVPFGGLSLTVEAVAENVAGARSAVTATTRVLGRRMPSPLVRGARDGTLSAQKVTLSTDAGAGEVRYTLAADGSWPPEVSAGSVLLSGPLVLDAAEGQTVSFRVALRAFDPAGAAEPSDEVTLAVTVDRTPPDPPVVSGIDDGQSYTEGRKATLVAPEGTIYAGVSSSGASFVPPQSDVARYGGPLDLASHPGRSVTYRIVAYSVDAAGNRSRETPSWTVTIDQQAVFLDASGNDYADGSRTSPVATLPRALKIALATGRHSVLVAAGEYALDRPLILPAGLRVVGGLDPQTWTPLGLERFTVVRPSRAWSGGGALVAVEGSGISIQGLEFTGSGKPLDALLEVRGGAIAVADCAFRLPDAASAAALVLFGGDATLTDTAFTSGASGPRAFIRARSGTLDVLGSAFNGPSGGDHFAAIVVEKGAAATLRGVRIEPGSAARTRGIVVAGGSLLARDTSVGAGAGQADAVAVDAEGGVVRLLDVAVTTPAAARSPTGILSEGAEVVMEGGTVGLEASASYAGVNARGGTLTVSRVTVRGQAIPEYAVLVRVEDARALLANNVLRGAAAGQSLGILVRGGAVDILNNTLLAGSGTSVSTGILVQGGAAVRVVNNVIVRYGRAEGTALSFLGARAAPWGAGGADGAAIVANNSFGGWKSAASVEWAAGAGRPSASYATAQAVNAADGDAQGGTWTGSLDQSPVETFRAPDDLRPPRAFAGLDAGVDLSDPAGPVGSGPVTRLGGVDVVADHDGLPRPAANPLTVPGPARGWDVGAFEYSD